MSPPTGHPTIEDVAAASSVSVATVSRALRGLPNVAPATRERVRAAAAALDYEVDPQASRLAMGRTMTMGLVAPLFGLWYADRVVSGAESVFAREGYDLLVASVRDHDTLESFLDRARSFGRRVDGTLLIDFYAEGHQLARLGALGVPSVSVGEDLGRWPSVTVDNRAGAVAATAHLIELGHTRIGLIGGDSGPTTISPVPDLRRGGWRSALAGAGLDARDEFFVDGGFTVDGGAAAAAHLLDLPEPPTAVFAMSDRMAIGVVSEARRRGLDVPGDLSIVGFDDDDLAAAFGLTTVRQPVEQLGAHAAALLVEIIGGAAAPPGREVYPVELVDRATTGPCP